MLRYNIRKAFSVTIGHIFPTKNIYVYPFLPSFWSIISRRCNIVTVNWNKLPRIGNTIPFRRWTKIYTRHYAINTYM